VARVKPQTKAFSEWEEYLRELSVYEAMKITSIAMGVRMRDVWGPSREQSISDARHACMRILRERFPRMSTTTIGKIMNRDHTSVVAGLRKKGVVDGSDAGAGQARVVPVGGDGEAGGEAPGEPTH